MIRVSSLNAPQVAIDRNVDNTTVDAVTNINANLPAILALSEEDTLADISAIAELDLTVVQEQITDLENLTALIVEILPAGTTPEVELVGNELQFKLPQGVDGLNGLTPIPTFAYDAGSGMLTVEVNEYSDINTGTSVIVSGNIDPEILKDEIIAEINTSEEW